jgi:hypothetical protein
VIDGVQLAGDYPASPVLAAAESLGVSATDPAVLVTVVVRGGAITANLLAPIVVDLASRTGAQIVLDPRRYQSSVPLGVARSTPPGPMPSTPSRLEAAAPLPAREPTAMPSYLDDNLKALVNDARSAAAILDAAPRGLLGWSKGQAPVLAVDAARVDAPCAPLSERIAARGSSVLVLVVGLGAGNLVRRARAETSGPLVIVELDAGLARAALEEIDLSDLSDTTLVIGWEGLARSWSITGRHARSATIVTASGYGLVVPEAVEAADRIRRLFVDNAVGDETFRRRMRLWVENVATNSHWATRAPAAMSLASSLRGVPVFVVAAGPSLDHAGPYLAEAARRGVVLTVDVAARSFVRHGAEPHGVFTLEANSLGSTYTDLPFAARIPLFASLTVHPHSLAAAPGPLAIFHERLRELAGPLGELLGVEGLFVGGNVTSAVFAFALQCGAGPIVLVGSDLGYPGGERYARGSAFEGCSVSRNERGDVLFEWTEELKQACVAHQPPRAQRGHDVPAWGGRGIVTTTDEFDYYRRWLESSVETAKRELADPPRFINASEGGVSIAGFEEISFRDVVASFPVRDVPDLADLVRTLPPAASDDRRREWARALAGSARGVEDAAVAARDVAARATTLHRGERVPVTAAFEDLASAESDLIGALRAAPLVDGYSFLAADRALEGAADEDPDGARAVAGAIVAEQRMHDEIAVAARSVATLFDHVASG